MIILQSFSKNHCLEANSNLGRVLQFVTFPYFEANSEFEHVSRFGSCNILKFELMILLEHLHNLVTKLELSGRYLNIQ